MEYDQPLALLANNVETDQTITRTDTMFASMVKALAPSQQDKIMRSAIERYRMNYSQYDGVTKVLDIKDSLGMS